MTRGPLGETAPKPKIRGIGQQPGDSRVGAWKTLRDGGGGTTPVEFNPQRKLLDKGHKISVPEPFRPKQPMTAQENPLLALLRLYS